MSKFPKEHVRAGVVASTIQVVSSSLVLFLLYRYLYRVLGVEQIGIWSLVLAATSVSRISELGLSAGVVRFVALARGGRDGARAAEVVQTAAVTLAVFTAIALALLWPLINLLLQRLVPKGSVTLALDIVPIALGSLWVSIIGNVFCGALDGCLRVDRRCLIMAASQILLLACALLLVPAEGLRGLAIAQLAQAAGLAIAAWFALKAELRELPVIPLRWSAIRLREMLGYGAGFQAITIMSLLFDPCMKVVLGAFGGLGSLGHYQMANRLILQGRSLIVEAGRVIVPSVAYSEGSDSISASNLYQTAYRVTYFTSILFYGFLGICLYGIGYLWIGRFEPEFLAFALILLAAWCVNTLIGPAYFSNLGAGRLKNNILSHVIMGVVAPLAGVSLGTVFGGVGVVWGIAIGLVAGSVYLLGTYLFRTSEIAFESVVPSGMAMITVLSFASVVAAAVIGFSSSSAAVVMLASGGVAALLASVGWINPARKELMARLIR